MQRVFIRLEWGSIDTLPDINNMRGPSTSPPRQSPGIIGWFLLLRLPTQLGMKRQNFLSSVFFFFFIASSAAPHLNNKPEDVLVFCVQRRPTDWKTLQYEVIGLSWRWVVLPQIIKVNCGIFWYFYRGNINWLLPVLIALLSHTPSRACQWTTLACAHKPGYCARLLLCWFIQGRKQSLHIYQRFCA